MRKYLEGLKGQQADAFHLVADAPRGDIVRITGYAGTGKSTVLGRIIDYLAERSNGRFILDRDTIYVGAPTHQAKKVLRSKISSEEVSIGTIHKGLRMRKITNDDGSQRFVPEVQTSLFSKDKPFPCEIERSSIVILEEVSMIGSYLGGVIMEMWARCHFTLILVGDSAQIPPVDEINSYFFSEMFEKYYHPKTVAMEEVIRQQNGSVIIDLATEIRNNLQASDSVITSIVSRYLGRSNKCSFISEIQGLEMSKVLGRYYDTESFRADHNYFKCIGYTRRIATKYAEFVRTMLFGAENIELQIGDRIIYNEPYTVNPLPLVTIQNNDEFRVASFENGKSIILNSSFETIVATLEDLYDGNTYSDVVIPKRFEMERLRELIAYTKNTLKKMPKGPTTKAKWHEFYKETERFSDISYLYGITAHRSQGNTYDYTLVDVGNILSARKVEERNRILYTSVTRAKDGMYIKLPKK